MPEPKDPKAPVLVGLDGQALARSGHAPERFVARRFALACDCGSENLVRFGPYEDGEPERDGEPSDPGLRWVFTCQACGNGVRFYATSPAWKERRLAESGARLGVAVATGADAMWVVQELERGRLALQRGEALPDDDAAAPGRPSGVARLGYDLEAQRVRDVIEAEARGYERALDAPARP